MSRPRLARFARAIALVAVLSVGAGACSDDGGGSVTTEGESGSGTGSASGTGSGSGTGSAAPEVDTIAEGKLTVCSDIPYAPFEYEEGGKVVGVDADLMRGVAGELGLEAEFKDTDFDGIFAALAAGSCDVVASSVSITDERKQNNEFTKGYFEINQSLLVRKGEETKLSDLPSFKGLTIGVQSETTGADFAKERAGSGGYTVKEFTDAAQLFAALKSKQIDGIVQDLPVNAYNAATTKETVVAKTFTEEDKEEYGFVVKKGNTELVEAIDEALEHLRDEGEYDEILKKYLGDAAPKSES